MGNERAARAAGRSKIGGGESVAVLRPAGVEAALEPARALRGTSVRERFGHHAPLRLLLQPIVADGARRVQRLLEVAGIELLHHAGVVSPHAGIAIRLQLHAHGDAACALRASARRLEAAERAGELL